MFKNHPEGIVLSVRVQPRAKRNALGGIHGNALKITLTAPPVDGAANKACMAFLAKRLGVAKSAFEILSGQTNRSKRILIRLAPGPGFKARCDELRKFLAEQLN